MRRAGVIGFLRTSTSAWGEARAGGSLFEDKGAVAGRRSLKFITAMARVPENSRSHSAFRIAPDMFQTAEDVRNEYCVQVKGVVRARPEGTTNDSLKSGKVEVLCHELIVLNASVTPPFQLDDDNLSETTRLTHRVLDLRRPYMQNNLMLRYRVAMETRKFLDANGFIDIETPMLTKSTPEGARDYLVPSRVNEGQFFALPQCPQLFKQLLMVAGFDRYYQITKCFRDEDLRADRQPEFTQIDIETSFMGEQEIRDMFQGMISNMFKTVLNTDLGEFPVMAYADAMHRLRLGQA